MGMCSAVHAVYESATIYNDVLPPLGELMREKLSKYNTSLGLGTSFAKDCSPLTRNYLRRSHFQAPSSLVEKRGRGFTAFQGQEQRSQPSYRRGSPANEVATSPDFSRDEVKGMLLVVNVLIVDPAAIEERRTDSCTPTNECCVLGAS